VQVVFVEPDYLLCPLKPCLLNSYEYIQKGSHVMKQNPVIKACVGGGG